MDKWDEEEASNSKTTVIHCRSSIQNIDGETKLLFHWSPCCKTYVQLNKGPEDEEADESVV
jgi:hypothetical protein